MIDLDLSLISDEIKKIYEIPVIDRSNTVGSELFFMTISGERGEMDDREVTLRFDFFVGRDFTKKFGDGKTLTSANLDEVALISIIVELDNGEKTTMPTFTLKTLFDVALDDVKNQFVVFFDEEGLVNYSVDLLCMLANFNIFKNRSFFQFEGKLISAMANRLEISTIGNEPIVIKPKILIGKCKNLKPQEIFPSWTNLKSAIDTTLQKADCANFDSKQRFVEKITDILTGQFTKKQIAEAVDKQCTELFSLKRKGASPTRASPTRSTKRLKQDDLKIQITSGLLDISCLEQFGFNDFQVLPGANTGPHNEAVVRVACIKDDCGYIVKGPITRREIDNNLFAEKYGVSPSVVAFTECDVVDHWGNIKKVNVMVTKRYHFTLYDIMEEYIRNGIINVDGDLKPGYDKTICGYPLVKQLANAIGRLYEKYRAMPGTLVHGDVHPRNIVFGFENGQWNAYMIDWESVTELPGANAQIIDTYRSKIPYELLIVTQILSTFGEQLKFNTSDQLAAVRQNALAIKHIKNPSEPVQLAAVKQNGFAIEYIENPSEPVQLAAVQQQNGLPIKYIKNPSEPVQLAAVQQNGLAIKYIKNPSNAVQFAAQQNAIKPKWQGRI